jgi:hypothetical protein
MDDPARCTVIIQGGLLARDRQFRRREKKEEPGDESRSRWALILASVASVMTALDLLVVSTALNTIRTELGASAVELQWTVTGYSLSFAALLMTGAALGDRFGRRRIEVIAMTRVPRSSCRDPHGSRSRRT